MVWNLLVGCKILAVKMLFFKPILQYDLKGKLVKKWNKKYLIYQRN